MTSGWWRHSTGMHLQNIGVSQFLPGLSAVIQMVVVAAWIPCSAAIMLPRCATCQPCRKLLVAWFKLGGWLRDWGK